MFPLLETSCACIPADALGVLAGLRGCPDVRVQIVGDRAWVRWTVKHEDLLRLLLPVHGADFYVWHEGHWYRPGSRLPASVVPTLENAIPLPQVIVPVPVQPLVPRELSGRPAEVWLRRSDRPRDCTALWCRIADLASWAETAPGVEIEAVTAARSGKDALLRGNRLPVAPGERYWGRTLYVPLGFEPVPDLLERDLCDAAGVGEDEVGLLRVGNGASDDGGPAVLESFPVDIFEPLTRAAIRLALLEMVRP
jgi:hypothetical protein